jgi:hypothetical protein
MEKAVQSTKEPKCHQKIEKMLYDELKGGKVKNKEDDDAGRNSVDYVRNCVL